MLSVYIHTYTHTHTRKAASELLAYSTYKEKKKTQLEYNAYVQFFLSLLLQSPLTCFRPPPTV